MSITRSWKNLSIRHRSIQIKVSIAYQQYKKAVIKYKNIQKAFSDLSEIIHDAYLMKT